MILNRWGGMGDVVMLLGACNAIKASGEYIVINTDPKFTPLAKACPFVDEVISEPEVGIDLNAIKFGLMPGHQIDNYLKELNVSTELDKTIVINAPKIEVFGDERIDKKPFVILHPSKGDPNRTLPMALWLEIAEAIKERGFEVVVMGSRDGIHKLKGYLHFYSTDPLASIALIQKSKALVSTDGGPIQLAGATDTPILGIYTVVDPSKRLPYRWGILGHNTVSLSPTCSSPHCYEELLKEDAFDGIEVNPKSLNNFLKNFCPEKNFRCCQELSAERVMLHFDLLMGIE